MNLKELCNEVERRPSLVGALPDCRCAQCLTKRERLAALLAAARLAPTWISVEERLPLEYEMTDAGEAQLIPIVNAGKFHIGWFVRYEDGTPHWFDCGKNLREVTHWMPPFPLPPSPLKEGRQMERCAHPVGGPVCTLFSCQCPGGPGISGNCPLPKPCVMPRGHSGQHRDDADLRTKIEALESELEALRAVEIGP